MSMQAEDQRGRTTRLALGFTNYISLGMVGAVLGVAWPSVRDTFQAPLDAMGILLTASTIGFLLTSFNSGRIMDRVGPGRFLLLGNALHMMGAVVLALAPSWWTVVLASAISGIGSGCVDSGLNTYVAAHYQPSRMNWLHAFFGLGSTLGPPLVTVILAEGLSWRWSYGTLSILPMGLAVYFLVTAKSWRLDTGEEEAQGGAKRRASNRETLKLLPTWMGIGLFFVFVGVELTAGQWSFTLLTEGRGLLVSSAGLWVSIYWGSLTVGRIVLGFVVDHVEATPMLRLTMIGAAIGAALLWWNPAEAASLAGLGLMGFSLASIFPVMISVTPERVGKEHAANAIGFQVASGGIGSALPPALAGVLARAYGLESIGLFLVIGSILMVALHEATLPRKGKDKRKQEAIAG